MNAGMSDDATTPAATDDSARRRRHAALVAVLVGVALLWLPSLFCGFVNWDDTEFCVKNPDVARLDVVHVFDPRTWVVGDWTPLATVTYWAERALFGASPSVPHATNVALHLVGAWLVFRLLRDIGFEFWESLAVAALFGVHPLQVESVTWVSARKNVLVAVFSLAFLRSYVAGRHAPATAWLVLALCSKATSVGLPLVAATIRLLGVGAPRRRTTWAWIAAWTALSVLRASISLAAQAGPLATIADLGFVGRMAYMGSVLTTQVGQVFAPTGLSILYDPPRREWTDPVLLAQWAGIAALLVVCVLAARRDKRLAVLGVFALAMMAPTLNVFPGPCLQADRYAHLPLIGIGAFLVAAISPLARLRPWAPAAALCAWILLVLMPATFARQRTWKTTEALTSDACLTAPTNGIAWGNYGAELLEQGRMDDARLALEKALTLPHPQPNSVLESLAFIATEAGDYRRAAATLEKVIATSPDDGRAHSIYGRICLAWGRIADAGTHLDVAARLDADWPRTWLYRAEYHVRVGRLDEAKADVARGRALKDGRNILASIAAAVDCLDGRPADAIADLREILPADATDTDIRALIANKLRFLGKDEAAAAVMR
jgi:Flp pilus assembly protein TadD